MKHAPITPHGKAPHSTDHKMHHEHLQMYSAGGHVHHSAHAKKHAAGHMMEHEKVAKMCGGGMSKK